MATTNAIVFLVLLACRERNVLLVFAAVKCCRSPEDEELGRKVTQGRLWEIMNIAPICRSASIMIRIQKTLNLMHVGSANSNNSLCKFTYLPLK